MELTIPLTQVLPGGGWLATSDCPSNIVAKYDKYVVESSGYMLLGSDGECVLLSEIITSDNFITAYNYYFTLSIDLTDCYSSTGTLLTGQYLNFIGKNYITFEEFVNRKESLNTFFTVNHYDSGYGWGIAGIYKGGYSAEIVPPLDTYLSIDNGGSYICSTTYWVP